MVTLRQGVPAFGLENNVCLENADVELQLPTEVGPRVLRYALRGRESVLAEVSPQKQRYPTPYGEDWHIYGGHRLWYAPEHAVRSYYPDNAPLEVTILADGVTLEQPIERDSGLQKQLTVQLAERGSHVMLRHKLINRGKQTHELAAWALTAMAPRGRAVFGHPSFVPHPTALSPARALVLWPFTRMNDPRFTWSDRFFALRQDPLRSEPQKVGFYDPLGTLLYGLDGQLFVKRHTPLGGVHADLGCNAQAFTNELFLELETLSPLVRLEPGAEVQHDEHWFLFDDVPVGESEEELSTLVARAAERVARELS